MAAVEDRTPIPVSEERRRGPRAALVIGSAVGWAAFVLVTVRYLVISVERKAEQQNFIHFDWHAYAAGATDLIDRSLYRQPLELGPIPLPLTVYNLPPLAALEAALFLPVGITPGGVAWQILAAGSVAFAAVVLARLWHAGTSWRDAIVVGGVLLGAYMLIDHLVIPDPLSYWWGLVLGTNNYLVLGLIAAFALAHQRGWARPAGILLGIAAATKLWPVTIGVLLLRERQWRVAGWAAGFVVLQGALAVLWLGPDVAPLAARALLQQDESPVAVIGVAALRGIVDWWPSWAGWAVGAALLAVPATGRAGIGLGILAGLAVITNLWGHYLPTVLFALGLITAHLVARRREAS
ncbi:MAG: glycosyltransferase family 87 protein [Candidatus Limnocylindria bacterium]